MVSQIAQIYFNNANSFSEKIVLLILVPSMQQKKIFGIFGVIGQADFLEKYNQDLQILKFGLLATFSQTFKPTIMIKYLELMDKIFGTKIRNQVIGQAIGHYAMSSRKFDIFLRFANFLRS